MMLDSRFSPPPSVKEREGRVTRQRLPLKRGDLFRSPDRPSAKWHRIIACRRRKNGTVYVTVRRGAFWSRLGLGKIQRLEMSMLDGVGYRVKP
jgi:hypothetical protein